MRVPGRGAKFEGLSARNVTQGIRLIRGESPIVNSASPIEMIPGIVVEECHVRDSAPSWRTPYGEFGLADRKNPETCRRRMSRKGFGSFVENALWRIRPRRPFGSCPSEGRRTVLSTGTRDLPEGGNLGTFSEESHVRDSAPSRRTPYGEFGLADHKIPELIHEECHERDSAPSRRMPYGEFGFGDQEIP